MTNPQEQFTELTRRTQEGFKHLWQQWSEEGRGELMKGVTSRSQATSAAGGNSGRGTRRGLRLSPST